MIESFLASWDLFGTSYLVALTMAGVLSAIGVWIVARDQIFFGAAVSQASTLGVATALWLGEAFARGGAGWLESDATPAAFAVVASVTTAWLVARASESTTESGESINGWVFLLATSLPVLMLAHTPHGLEEVQRLMFSTLLSVSPADLTVFVVLAAATAALAARFHAPLLLLAMDPEMAGAVGMRARRWHGLTAIWLGIAVGLSIRVAGLLFTFGCLVLPPLVAKNLCREVRPMLLVAPAVALFATAAGLVVAHVGDLPPADAAVGVMCLSLPLAWLVRARRRTKEA